MKYIRLRDGVFQYERRVPVEVQRDASRFAERFGSKPLFRRSLGTKCQHEMHQAAERVDAEFKRLISDAPAVPKGRKAVMVPTRTVTNADLDQIADRYCAVTAEPMERLYRLADVDAAAAAELERLEYDLERDADDIMKALRGRSEDDPGIILKPAEEARHVIAQLGFRAPEGSDERGAIVAAVRVGMERGYTRITALAKGEAIPALPVPSQRKPASTQQLTLAEAVERYLAVRKPPAKAVSESNLALRQFEEAVGRKLLAAITREDVHRFVEHLANQTVGGKWAGSIARPLSEHSIGKRLRLLSAAINHARDAGRIEGENPAQGIRIATFVKASDKAVMPEKRRFQVSELNSIFAHPWFTGCKSASETHLPGTYRLTGSEYWASVVAAWTGCRAAELGGLRIAEVRLDDPHPHIIIRDNRYRRTKNGRSRCIPLLDGLLELGFDEYVRRVAAAGHDRVFPNWIANQPPPKRELSSLVKC